VRNVTEQSDRVVLTEELVSVYERLVPLAAEQVACLRRGDIAGFERLLGQKERVIEEARARIGAESERLADAIPSGAADDARLVARAEEAIRNVLANEQQALAVLLAARDQVSGELSGLARADAGLRGYGGAAAATRAYDQRG